MLKKIIVLTLFVVTSLAVFAAYEDTSKNNFNRIYGSGQTYRGYSTAPAKPELPVLNPNQQQRQFGQDPDSTTRYDAKCQFGVCLGAPSSGGSTGNR
ncbi:MAG: hypothetical protein LUB59_07260 [Candidatus Gastranaerophilales bacterium]|nr:hypothetical protein [Candidatus Gastranaerophilales bacterium]